MRVCHAVCLERCMRDTGRCVGGQDSAQRICVTSGRLCVPQAAAALARKAVDGRAGTGSGQPRSVRVAGSLPPLGESYATEGGQRAAELAQPTYQQVQCDHLAISRELRWRGGSTLLLL